VGAALDLLGTVRTAGHIADLGRHWGSDDWRRQPLSGGGRGDGRQARSPEPIYQLEADRELALRQHGGPDPCRLCVGAEIGSATA
jgi:hypothetical protein